MNINFNILLQKILPFAFVILVAYIMTSLFSLFLPKSGIDFTEDSSSSLVYERYNGFYSKVSAINTPKIDKKIERKSIETLSKYQLKAVYSTTSNGGWAIIEEKSSNKSTILEQFQKFNGYTLTKLFRNFVIFEKDLKEFKIELPNEKEINYEVEKQTVLGNENIIVNEDSVRIKRNYLNAYVNDIEKVWKNIAIEDIRKNGKIEGFKIEKVNTNSIFGKLGLVQNDVIKTINGKKITSYSDAFKIYNEINKLEYLTIEVLRNNEIVELNYEID